MNNENELTYIPAKQDFIKIPEILFKRCSKEDFNKLIKHSNSDIPISEVTPRPLNMNIGESLL